MGPLTSYIIPLIGMKITLVKPVYCRPFITSIGVHLVDQKVIVILYFVLTFVGWDRIHFHFR